MKYPILLLDDDPIVRELLTEDLPAYDFEVHACKTAQEALRVFDTEAIQAILLDYRLAHGTGADFFHTIKDRIGNIPVIFITNFPDIQQAVDLIKEGATDYIMKPLSPAAVADRVQRAIESNTLRSEVNYHRRKSPSQHAHELIGSSAVMRRVRTAISEMVQSPNTPVLITGETGTGKEVVAQMIHQATHGDREPFIEVDCATIPHNLFESELFGHERGSFTSAARSKEGIFELGRKGTIFLDEIGEVNMELQSRLLRVLETRQFRRVGGTRPLRFNARIITATNRQLRDLMAIDRFRSDLYYRIAVYEITIPPLRERGQDIIELAMHFLKQALTRHHKALSGLSHQFTEKLLRHVFPGNVRELRNLVEQAVIQTATGHADLIHFVPQTAVTNERRETPPLREAGDIHTLRDQEGKMIEAALTENGGNKSAAARQLGISRPALIRRIIKLRSS